ncbi:MAG TPA: hypothetical protein VKW76_05660 [Candidatus Binatia bacterium]|nr:hypothetical protein [Candidatus Binatia bacterium]
MVTSRVGRLLALAALGALATGVAEATTLCASRAGLVSIRDACKRREHAIAPQDVGLVGGQGPAGLAGAPGAPGMIPYQLVDADGHAFGTLLSFDGATAQAIFQPPGVGVPLVFEVAYGQWSVPLEQQTIFYAAAGCVGTPLIVTNGSTASPQALVIGTRGYFSQVAPSFETPASEEFVPSTPGDCGADVPTGRGTCCASTSNMRFTSPAQTFDATALGVSLPFTVVPR